MRDKVAHIICHVNSIFMPNATGSIINFIIETRQGRLKKLYQTKNH